MRGENGSYVAHVHFTGGTVPQLTVTNASDTPPTVKPSKPVDAIKGQAVWNADNNTLTVKRPRAPPVRERPARPAT